MPKRAKPRAYHHGDLRRALLDAALCAIAEAGPEALSLRDLARKVGVSPAAPYRHFADKDALLAAVAGECGERLGALMDAAAAEAKGDPMERFRLSGIAYVRFAVENPAHFRVMNLPGVAENGALRREVGAWMEEEAEELAAAQRAGLLADIPVPQIMLAAQALSYGLARLLVDGHIPGATRASAIELAESITAVLGFGLLPRGPT